MKLDCIALRDFKRSVEDATKDPVGYILMPLKNLPILPLAKALQMKPRWMRLIGLSKDWRQQKPELLVNVMITAKEYLTCNRSEVLEDELALTESVVIGENPVPRMLTSQHGMFIRLLEDEGLLQVGNIDTECDIFRVHILIKGIRNLETLAADKHVDLFFNYIVLGNEHMRALDKKFSRMHQIQEKISINFRSSLRYLREYFDKVFYIPFEINSGSNVLGESGIRLNNFIKTTSLADFIESNPQESTESIQIKLPSSSQTFAAHQQIPVLEVKIAMKYVSTKKLLQTEFLERSMQRQHDDPMGGGDNHSEKNAEAVKFDDDEHIETTKSQKSVNLDTIKSHISDEKKSIPVERIEIASSVISASKSNDIPKVFAQTLRIDSIKFNRKPEKGIWQFTFINDKADIVKAFVNREIVDVDSNLEQYTVAFEDLELKLYFTSTSSQINSLIGQSESCTLTIKGPRSYHVRAQLDCKNLIAETGEGKSGIVLLQSASDDSNALVQISVNLAALGLNFNSQISSDDVQNRDSAAAVILNDTKMFEERKALMLDEDLTYKMIEELELWKDDQKKVFCEELKSKEKKFLNQLKESWMKKQEKLELELHEKAEKLACMTKNLEEAKNVLAEKCPRFNESDIEKVRKTISEYYQNEIAELKEQSQRNEAEMRHEMRMLEIKADDSARATRLMEAENRDLNEKFTQLQKQLKCQIDDSVPKFEVEKLAQDVVSMLETLDVLLRFNKLTICIIHSVYFRKSAASSKSRKTTTKTSGKRFSASAINCDKSSSSMLRLEHFQIIAIKFVNISATMSAESTRMNSTS